MNNYEFTQRIKGNYVNDKYVNVMIPHFQNSAITMLSSNETVYHHKKNHEFDINKNSNEYNINQLFYYNIGDHKNKFKFNKIEYINKTLHYNKIYIDIQNGLIKETYAVKDNDEAIVVTKILTPNGAQSKLVTKEELIKLINNVNIKILSYDGSKPWDISIPTDEQMLEYYKELIVSKKLELERYYDISHVDEELNNFFKKGLDKLTINDVPSNINIINNAILVDKKEDEINCINLITVKFMGPDCYMIESYKFPITHYTLDYIKTIEQTTVSKSKLNKTINKNEIKKAKKLVLLNNKQN